MRSTAWPFDLAWSLWTELGADGIRRRHDWQAIDLEPVESLWRDRLIQVPADHDGERIAQVACANAPNWPELNRFQAI